MEYSSFKKYAAWSDVMLESAFCHKNVEDETNIMVELDISQEKYNEYMQRMNSLYVASLEQEFGESK
jgi:hypothetical protein